MGGVEFRPVRVHFQDDRGAAERSEKAEKNRLLQRKLQEQGNSCHGGDREQHLNAAADQELPARPQDVPDREFKSDREQEEYDADIGEALDHPGFRYDRGPMRTDEDAGNEEPDQGRQFGAVKMYVMGSDTARKMMSSRSMMISWSCIDVVIIAYFEGNQNIRNVRLWKY